MSKLKMLTREFGEFLTFASSERLVEIRSHLHDDNIPEEFSSGIPALQFAIVRFADRQPILLVAGVLVWSYLAASGLIRLIQMFR